MLPSSKSFIKAWIIAMIVCGLVLFLTNDKHLAALGYVGFFILSHIWDISEKILDSD